MNELRQIPGPDLERWPCGCAKGVTPHGAGWSDCIFTPAQRADMEARVLASQSFDPQSDLFDRFVRRGERPDAFSAKRLYPGLTIEAALSRIRRLRDAR